MDKPPQLNHLGFEEKKRAFRVYQKYEQCSVDIANFCEDKRKHAFFPVSDEHPGYCVECNRKYRNQMEVCACCNKVFCPQCSLQHEIRTTDESRAAIRRLLQTEITLLGEFYRILRLENCRPVYKKKAAKKFKMMVRFERMQREYSTKRVAAIKNLISVHGASVVNSMYAETSDEIKDEPIELD